MNDAWTADDELAATLLGDDLDGLLQDDLTFDGDAEGLLQLAGGGTRPPPRPARPGANYNPPGVEPAPERLYLDWQNMSDEEYYATLGALARQRQSQDRIDGLQGAIRSLDPTYEFHPIVTARGSGTTYESHLRDELGRVRMRVTLGNQEIDVNGYQYRFDASGRMASVGGDLTLNRQNTRNQPAQLRAGGLDRLLGDQGGHYIGRQFNGPTREFNHFAQDGNFNMGAYRALEGQWARSLEQGSRVNVRIAPTYTGSSLRPTSITVTYQVNNARPVERIFTNRHGGQ